MQRRGAAQQKRGSVETSTSSLHPTVSPWSVPIWLLFAPLAVVRVYAAFRCPIADCDETFNYWEPTHYLMYGFGLQARDICCILSPPAHTCCSSPASWSSNAAFAATTDVGVQPALCAAVLPVRGGPCGSWVHPGNTPSRQVAGELRTARR